MFKLSQIIQATKGKCSSFGKDISFSGISTDSRTIKKGELFIALHGPNFDGNRYVADAFKKGASAAVATKTTSKEKPVILVKDSLKALHDIALFHRKRMKAKIIGITGTSGKTTTKDMTASILSKAGATLKTEKNLNNEIGAALTLLKIKPFHRYAVIEMAMQAKGQIRQLGRICLPDIAVVTNTGFAHLKQLKTRRNVALAKSEIFETLNKNCFAVINKDDDYFGLMQKKATHSLSKVITFGIVNASDVSADNISIKNNKTSFALTRKNKIVTIKLGVPGGHNIYNALASAAAATALKIDEAKIQNGLSKTVFSGKRLEITKGKNNTTIINDTYNANPSSMRAAIATLASLEPVKIDLPFKRIAVLGDMLELGRISKKAHRDTGKEAAASGIDVLVAAGKEAKDLYLGAKQLRSKSRSGFECYYFADKSSAAKKLKKLIAQNDIILYKASRGMKFEGLIRT